MSARKYVINEYNFLRNTRVIQAKIVITANRYNSFWSWDIKVFIIFKDTLTDILVKTDLINLRLEFETQDNITINVITYWRIYIRWKNVHKRTYKYWLTENIVTKHTFQLWFCKKRKMANYVTLDKPLTQWNQSWKFYY